MNAITARRYGGPDVLQVEDLPAPVPAENEVLVRQHASSVNAADWHLLRADPWLVRLFMGIVKPRHPVIGCDVAGVVDSVGAAVTDFKPGDAVFGEASRSGWGAFAELVCVKAEHLAHKPAEVSFEQAAATTLAALTAIQGLRDHGRLNAGKHVLVNGASGGVGHMAVQVAKSMGARVTAVASTEKLDLLRECGADHVVDYRDEDVTQSGQQFDVIFEAALNRPLNDYKPILKPDGRFVFAGGESHRFIPIMLLNPLAPLIGRIKVESYTAAVNREDLQQIATMLASGAIAAHIDRRFPLEQTADAIRYMEERKVKGKVVIDIGEDSRDEGR